MSTQTIKDYAHDLLALNKHTLSVIRGQKNAESVRNQKALDLLHNIDIALTTQNEHLRSIDGLIEEDNVNKIKEGLASATGSLAGMIDKVRTDTVSKMIRDDYTALSMIASGYTMLNTAAVVEGNDELKDLTASSLERIAQLITETSKVIPFVVAEELTDDISRAQSIAEEAHDITQKAWKPEAIFEEA